MDQLTLNLAPILLLTAAWLFFMGVMTKEAQRKPVYLVGAALLAFLAGGLVYLGITAAAR